MTRRDRQMWEATQSLSLSCDHEHKGQRGCHYFQHVQSISHEPGGQKSRDECKTLRSSDYTNLSPTGKARIHAAF